MKRFSNLRNNEIILVHDAVRPFIRQGDITNLVNAMQTHRAATLGIPVSDTLRRGDKNAGETVDRNGLWAIQTPQAFHYDTLKDAHDKAGKDTMYTDDTTLVSAMGVDVAIVQGHKQNFKITTPDDMDLALKLLSAEAIQETRTAQGYDVHAFDDKGDHVILCGIKIPAEKSLKGHSDADVGLHAITDALLGCISAGDIGTHFPPSDPQWKGKDSAHFLEHAVKLIEDKGGIIKHIDITLICEMPKIDPHREAMQTRIASICGLIPAQISIKATTTEGLGFTGRKEGIAAQAMATITLPV